MNRDHPPACSGLTSIFYSDLGDDRQFAVDLCKTCPYCQRCLSKAVARGEMHGVWGGRIFGDQRTVPKAERVRGGNRFIA